MAQSQTLSDAREKLNEIDGIEANPPDSGRVLVKVMEESSIGKFFKACRELGLERSSTTRGDLGYTEMDSWVSFGE